ncbi:hypothetical protein ACIQ9P_38345 [Kitasatospora sp. NPDC094019]|uniref:hypothetical protein n=1 Tax=Kitasatospora sp. NPDC094019 TaxID=3364091 RepID=UPI003807787B
MNQVAVPEDPAADPSTWTIERLRTFAADAAGQQLETVRVVAQAHAYHSHEPRDVRQQWAKLSLQANHRMHGDGLWDRARMAQHDFMLRTWIIDQFGPDEDPDWSPEKLAADTLAALTLAPAEARVLADRWRDLPVEQIGELRRHKNLTTHLDRLANHLEPGPVRDRLIDWTEARSHLP